PAGVPHGATAGEDAAQQGIDGVLVGGLLELMEGALGEHGAGAGAGGSVAGGAREHDGHDGLLVEWRVVEDPARRGQGSSGRRAGGGGAAARRRRAAEPVLRGAGGSSARRGAGRSAPSADRGRGVLG